MSARRLMIGLATLLALTAQAQATPLNVEILGAPSDQAWNIEVQSKLMATGLFGTVDIFGYPGVYSVDYVTPTLAQLQDYDAVLVYADLNFADPVTLGNNLDAYAQGGGGVVLAAFDFTFAGAQLAFSNFAADFAIDPNGVPTGPPGATLGAIHVPGSPLVAGVTSFNTGTGGWYDAAATPVPGAIDVADYSNGVPLIVSRAIHGTQTVDLNFYPPSSDSRGDFWDAGGDGARIMANALTFTANASATAVPEPVSLLLFGTGLGLAALLRRRQPPSAPVA